MDKAALNRLTVARTSLVLEQPFFGALALRLKLVEDASISTACTNGAWIKYNPQFINSLPIPQIKGIFAHEVLHCVLLHHLRRDHREPIRWNCAGDYVINLMLLASKFQLPEGCLIDWQYDNMATEIVYSKLSQAPQKAQSKPNASEDTGDGPNGQSDASDKATEQGKSESQTSELPNDPCGEVVDATSEDGQTLSPSEVSEQIADWQTATQQAAQQARAMGKLPAAMSKLIDGLIHPSITSWEVLRRFIDSQAKSDYSLIPPNRRHVWNGLYLPSLHSEELGNIIIAVDSSGSIDNSILQRFASELSAILEQFTCCATILYFDTQIHHVEEYASEDLPIKLTRHCGGGTSFIPIFSWIDEHMDTSPTCLVVLTDCHGSFPQSEPDYPVLWASITPNYKVPFGEFMYLDEMCQ